MPHLPLKSQSSYKNQDKTKHSSSLTFSIPVANDPAAQSQAIY